MLRFYHLVIAGALMLSQSIHFTHAQETEEENSSSVYLSDTLKHKVNDMSQFSVAVLPMENVSVNPEVAYHFRQRVIELLVAKGYTVLGQEWVDEALYELGLTHAGQLRLLSMEQLSAVVRADAFMFGIVEEARTQNAVAYNAYVYKSSLKMDAPTGENLWYSLEQRVSKRRFAIDPINAVLDIFLIDEGGDAKDAVGALADRLMDPLVDGPVQLIVGDDLLSMATEVSVITTQPTAAGGESVEQDVTTDIITASNGNTTQVSVTVTSSTVDTSHVDDSTEKSREIQSLQLEIEQLTQKLGKLEARLKELEGQ